MSALTLKGVPEPLLRRLRKVAHEQRRSLNQQVLAMLEAKLDEPVKVSPVEAQLAAWRALAAEWDSDVAADAEAKAILKRRTKGRVVRF